ncbi:Pentatricopeptide repeat-containing protein [Thalictrum thalictroides]|uniref:Pentatricopeptide repeat-containing protein n=1 Tax=Thalictrum thalictroides TaxID=46969 RepID=A0A7J6VKY4_THATH|nr:Pentatricopeptide repeat-containing protein [Thalictrum thalictroides]
MEEALNVLDLMEAQGMEPEPSLICILLKSCAEAENLEFGKTIHSRIVGTDLEKDVYVVNNLINLYAKCGCLEIARNVFDEMSNRNEVTWTTMISIYNQRGFLDESLKLYSLMKLDSRVRPNAFTYSIALNSCAKLRNLKMGVEIHEDVVKDRCESDEFIVTALIDMYSKCGSIDSARRVFNKAGEPTIAACTAMIDGYNNNNQAKEAMYLIRIILHSRLDMKMVRELGFVCMIRSCTMEAAYRQGQEIHAHIIKFGYDLGAQTCSTLVLLYEDCNKMVLARRLFDKLVDKNERLWGQMILGYVKNGMNSEALKLYVEMVSEDVKPSSFALSCALKACVGILGLKEGMEIQGRAVKVGCCLSDDSFVAALVMLYRQCKLPEEVQKITRIHKS